MKIIKKAYAKVNLTLDVLNRRSDGYHNITSIMQTLDLHDIVTIEKSESGINAEWNTDREMAADNTVIRASELMFEKYKLHGGVKISVEKKIPISAGLGGGSADAAAVIEGINELFGLDIDRAALMEEGIKIGADVPFCIFKGAALAEGIGERLTRLPSKTNCQVVVVKPDIDVSTKKIFEEADRVMLKHRPDTNAALTALKAGDLKNLCRNLNNVLETVTAGEHPIIIELKRKMALCGASGALMSGSGPSVYGIFRNSLQAENALAHFKNEYGYEVFICGFYYPNNGGDVRGGAEIGD